MREITLEVKQKIFGLYLFGEAIVTKGSHNRPLGKVLDICGEIIKSVGLEGLIKNKFAVSVKPLKLITDEDAIGFLSDKIFKVDFISRSNMSITICYVPQKSQYSRGLYIFRLDPLLMRVEEADYWRSKGYALPACGFSVDELVQARVFKLKK